MLWGSGEEPDAAKAGPSTGEVVAYSLAVAAVLSAAGVVAQATAFSGFGIGERLVQATLFSTYPIGLALAAAVASLLCTTSGGRRGRLRTAVDGAIAIVAAAAVVASAYSVLALSVGRVVGAPRFGGLSVMIRLGYGGAAVGTLCMAVAVLWCRRSERRDVVPAETVADDVESELLAWRVVMPTVACVLAAVVAMVASAGENLWPSSGLQVGSGSGGVQGFASGPDASYWTRLGRTSLVFNNIPIAFAAFTVVMLVAAATRGSGRRRTADWFGTTAGVVGLIAVAAAAHTVARAIGSSDRFGFFNGSFRVEGIATALGSGVVGVAAGLVDRRLRLGRLFDASTVRDRIHGLRPSMRVVARAVTAAAVGSAVLDAMIVATASPSSIGDRAVIASSFVLLTAGLALGAVIVAASSGVASTQLVATGDTLSIVAAVVAGAALAHAAYVTYFVLFGHTDGRSSIKEYTTTAQQFGFVAQAVAVGLIATGTLLLVWRTRCTVPFDEPEYTDDGIPIVDLAP